MKEIIAWNSGTIAYTYLLRFSATYFFDYNIIFIDGSDEKGNNF